MKKIILSLFLLGSLTFSGCKKEPLPLPEVPVNILADEEPQSLVDSLEVIFFDSPLTSEITSTTDALILDYPLFLDYNPFTNVTVRTPSSIDSCVRDIEITPSEKEKLTKAWNNKTDCQKTNKELISKIHRDLESRYTKEKASMYSKYIKTKDSLSADFKTKVSYINDKYSKGLITLEQKNKSLNEVETKYHNDLASLEKSYKSGLEDLNFKLKKEIRSNIERATACGKIKDCEKIYLNSVLEILGKIRYKKWIECYKYHYRTK